MPVGTVLPVEEVHAFEPVPAELAGTPAADLVIGAQCGLWTEAIDNVRALDYQAFPRLSAFAETVWCAAERDRRTSRSGWRTTCGGWRRWAWSTGGRRARGRGSGGRGCGGGR
ncbi:family 20 glycosylhydrolase [Streptomyces synnematoformans]|uniref:Glycoside hydrolase family 20 catalytic domain-containing protein n=1 Tax=Streptomyces synnematoformans TaxID=415721 RepID=A0ABP5J673_9ACTN